VSVCVCVCACVRATCSTCCFLSPVLAARGPPGLLYHVQYFGDCAERGYVLDRCMVSFRGVAQYEELSQAKKAPASCAGHKVALPLQQSWLWDITVLDYY